MIDVIFGSYHRFHNILNLVLMIMLKQKFCITKESNNICVTRMEIALILPKDGKCLHCLNSL